LTDYKSRDYKYYQKRRRMMFSHERLGFFNIRLAQRMNEVGVSTAEVAIKARLTYEHVRKLILGNYLPSASVLERLCGVLGLSRHDMKQRVARDRMIFKFGDAAWTYWGMTPRSGQLHILFSVLSAEEQEFVRLWIISFGEAKRKMKKDLDTKEEIGGIGS
jgi:transcriptional regulator with XRE-family HTH domain